jgi:ElaB/YqjD/DUF883 family membrane-anchored ribosome-binding protein
MQTQSSSQQPNGQGVATASSAIAATDSARAAVAREYKSFVADIEDLVKATTLLTGEELARAKAKLMERVASARKSAEEVSESIVQQARKSAAVTDRYVHEEPWKAVGIGAAVGLVIGLVLARRV